MQRLEQKVNCEIRDCTELCDSCKKCCHLQKRDWYYTRGKKRTL